MARSAQGSSTWSADWHRVGIGWFYTGGNSQDTCDGRRGVSARSICCGSGDHVGVARFGENIRSGAFGYGWITRYFDRYENGNSGLRADGVSLAFGGSFGRRWDRIRAWVFDQ